MANAGKSKKGTLLWRVGFWATIWWGVSCAYLLLLVWLAKDLYANSATTSLNLAKWGSTIKTSYHHNGYMPWLLLFILAGWFIGSFFWLKALKISKISVQAGLKDLFLTIRK